MVKFPEAAARLHYRVFVCKRCKTKMRSDPQRVTKRQIKCRKCQSHAFRAIRVKK